LGSGTAVLFDYRFSVLRSQSAKPKNIESGSTVLPQAKADYQGNRVVL
jgi:hypothetical protein